MYIRSTCNYALLFIDWPALQWNRELLGSAVRPQPRVDRAGMVHSWWMERIGVCSHKDGRRKEITAAAAETSLPKSRQPSWGDQLE